MVATSIGATLGTIAVSALASTGISAGISALRGGSAGDILKSAGLGGAIGGVTGGIGSAVVGPLAGMIGSGLSKAGNALSGIASTGSLLAKAGTGLANVGTKLSTSAAATAPSAALHGTPTGGASSIENTTLTNAATGGLLSSNHTSSVLSDAISSATKSGTGLPGELGQLSIRTESAIVNGQSTTATTLTPTGSTTASANVNAAATGGIKDKIKGIGKKVAGPAGQYVVQGALSLLSAGQAAKEARAANQIQQQSLDFQKKMYNDSVSKEKATKAKLKKDAWQAYESASLFGKNIYDSDSNSTLLTNIESQDNYSILTPFTSKKSSTT